MPASKLAVPQGKEEPMKAQLVTALVAMQVVFGSAAAEHACNNAHAQAASAYDQAIRAEQSGDVQGAVKLYKKAISLDPRETLFYVSLGELYQHKNDLV